MIRAFALCVALLVPAQVWADAAIFRAIEAGDEAAVARELANGVSVDSRTRDQATPLIAAALADQSAIAELLLEKGADVMARNSGGFTPLHAAAYSGSVPILEMLLEREAVLEDDNNKAGVTALMVAGELDHLAAAEFLVSKGADVNHAEIHGYLPITRALFKGNIDIIKLYKRHGAMCQSGFVGWYEKCMEIAP